MVSQDKNRNIQSTQPIEIDIDFDSRVEHVEIYNVHNFPYDILKHLPLVEDNRTKYYNIPVAFDIETTTILTDKKKPNGKPIYEGFMYLWQFCICETVIMGRTWEEFLYLLDILESVLQLNRQRRLVIYVHNLAFEFQFIRNFVVIDEMFARKRRKPIRFLANNVFEFRCSYFLSNMALSKFISNTPNARFNKLSGDDFDYTVLRLPNTQLSQYELAYSYCDVRGLCEAIAYLLQEDTLSSIPLTSTGYVRRDARKAIFVNPLNKLEVNRLRLSPREYTLCKEASRGGNTHANPDITGHIIEDMKSKDRKSSYPAEMVVDFYPVSPFQMIRPSRENLEDVVMTKACLLDITFYNIRALPTAVMNYISKSKCKLIKKVIADNGRVAFAEEARMVITDVDYSIIIQQYVWTDIEIHSIDIADYGRLPKEFRQLIMDYFLEKTKLENGDPYLYMKFKNKINAFFGMMLTDIASPEIIFLPSNEKIWVESPISLDSALDSHYKKRSTFQSYQQGIWVTANARKRLQDALNCVGSVDAHYCDTDSVKFTGDHESDFERVNEQWLADCENCDIAPYVTVNGKTTYLGRWEDDGEYKEFITLGSKKYAYIKANSTDELTITVAGLNKKKGSAYLQSHGGLEAFKIGTKVPAGDSGRTTAYYNDYDAPFKLTVKGCTFTTGSNIAIVNTEYTFGISDDYASYLLNVQGEEIYEEYFEIDTELDSN